MIPTKIIENERCYIVNQDIFEEYRHISRAFHKNLVAMSKEFYSNSLKELYFREFGMDFPMLFRTATIYNVVITISMKQIRFSSVKLLLR